MFLVMTEHDGAPTDLMTGPFAEAGARPGKTDAVTLLSCYLFLLMAIPPALVVGSFGAAGGPAALFAAVLLCWYLAARHHPAIGLNGTPQLVRGAGLFFACAVIAAYISANRATMPASQESGADRGLIVLAGWLGVLLLAADGIDHGGG